MREQLISHKRLKVNYFCEWYVGSAHKFTINALRGTIIAKIHSFLVNFETISPKDNNSKQFSQWLQQENKIKNIEDL